MEVNILEKYALKDTISVIVPIYNAENHLEECLESIVQQSYECLEIILVNDGSTDMSAQICNKYAAKDPRVKVVHRENEGAAASRNVGLKHANGDFVGFVDSDDIIAKNFYEILMGLLKQNHADIVECGFLNFDNLTDIGKLGNKSDESINIYCTKKALSRLMDLWSGTVVWNKVYKRSTIKNIEFPKGQYIDDEFWTYRVLGQAQRLVVTEKQLYFYRQQESSIMGRKYSIKRLDGLQAIKERIFYMQKHFPELENKAIKSFCFGSAFHYEMLIKNEGVDPQKKYRKQLIADAAKYNVPVITSNWSLSEKIQYWFFIFAPELYVNLMKLYFSWRIKDTSETR